ncbi:MAG: DegT/DnrJ/EryC1/StrS family aminotransferase [Woronichinia naegeliana WA131]|uniref:DegT/DnrJ/EryC1/StrS family aminotransferase n=1 Tax=Woronichinia naegeliana WA131 TaxID=2824559 RepID=A0A977KZ36_9CYAN|nr:MAG: DegT/DnrJ/EryC1/StrS family aminotransferase [Woronichinia naegeliana WA131]
MEDLPTRTKLIAYLKEQGINSVFHYVPLHSSPAGEKYAKVSGDMTNTDSLSNRLLRLPLYPKLTTEKIFAIAKTLYEFYGEKFHET